MKKSRIAAILLLSLLVGCGESGIQTETTTDSGASGASEETTKSGEPVIPEGTDYGGYEFRVMARGNGKWICIDMYAEEENGESINDAVFRRNQYVSEKLNVTFSQTTVKNDADLTNQVQKSISAGDDEFDIIWMGAQKMFPLVLDGLFVNLNDIKSLDLSSDWWDPMAVSNLTLNDKIFMTTGDISIISNYATYVITFNKTEHRDYKLDDLYSLVKSGKWTFDAFQSMARQVSDDLNGDGVFDENDRFGYITYKADYTGFMFAAGGSFSKTDGDKLTTNYNTERVIDQLTDLASLHSENCTYFGTDDNVMNKIFVESRALFSFRTLINLNFYRNMETDYGIIPMPKYDEKDEYRCGVHAHGLSLIAVPVTNSDTERTGLILDLMGYKSKEVLTPAFYDTTLKGKYFRDEESGDMLDIIFKSRVYDIGYFGNWGNLHSKFETMSAANEYNFASVFESIRPSVEESLAKTIEAYS